jgi:hypothetical protein
MEAERQIEKRPKHHRGSAPLTAQPSHSRPNLHPLLGMQRHVGNQAVQSLLRSRAIQAKLAIGQPNDLYEQEADRVADRVMRMPDPAQISPIVSASPPELRRVCSQCENETNKKLQTKVASSTPSRVGSRAPASDVPYIVSEVLSSPGQPLDPATRAFFEPRFGLDLTHVRMHDDAPAASSATAVDALAYTVGNHVVFAKGQYAPNNNCGRSLLAHELTHVVQQSRSTVQPSVQRACSDGTWINEYDGCSLPAFLAGPLGIKDKNNPAGGSDTQFGLGIPTSAGGKACDTHDECYQTCSLPGKEHCDQQFGEQMLAICAASSESASVKANCIAKALVYFGGVSVFGDIAFSQRQAQVCGCSLLGKPGPGDFPTPPSGEQPA